MNRVLVVFSDGLLSELDSARGLVSRSAWIRQAVEDKLMKEAVASLVPDYGGLRESLTLTGNMVTSVRRGIRPEDIVIPEPKPKARRKKKVEPEESIDLMVALKDSIEARKANPPARCNRGACTGTINPVSGRCLHCNQTPLKESK